MIRSTTFVVMLCALTFSCSKDSSTSPSSSTTSYGYTATDSTGVIIALGTFSIDVFDSAKMSGTWNLAASNGATSTMFGPQFGSGTWNGTRTALTLAFNLNPEMVDNNVVLNGTATYASAGDIVPASFRGDWSWSTLHGITNHGSFVATRK